MILRVNDKRKKLGWIKTHFFGLVISNENEAFNKVVGFSTNIRHEKLANSKEIASVAQTPHVLSIPLI